MPEAKNLVGPTASNPHLSKLIGPDNRRLATSPWSLLAIMLRTCDEIHNGSLPNPSLDRSFAGLGLFGFGTTFTMLSRPQVFTSHCVMWDVYVLRKHCPAGAIPVLYELDFKLSMATTLDPAIKI